MTSSEGWAEDWAEGWTEGWTDGWSEATAAYQPIGSRRSACRTLLTTARSLQVLGQQAPEQSGDDAMDIDEGPGAVTRRETVYTEASKDLIEGEGE